LVSVAACVCIALVLVFEYTAELKVYRKMAIYRARKHDFALVPGFVESLLDIAEPGDTVLYMDEVPMLYSLVNGSHCLGSTYYPLLLDPSTRSHWLDRSDYLVSWNNPYMKLVRYGDQYPARLNAGKIEMVSCHFDEDQDVSALSISVDNPGEEFVIPVSVSSNEGSVGGGEEFRIAVPQSYEGWVSAEGMPVPCRSRSVRMHFDHIKADSQLRGIKLSDHEGGLMWSWERGCTIEVRYKDGEGVAAAFDLKSVFDRSMCMQEARAVRPFTLEEFPDGLEVLSDEGFLVLLGVGAPASGTVNGSGD